MPNKLLTISELAEILDVHPDTIRKWELQGHIVSRKTVGGHRRYLQSEVDNLVHKMQFPAQEAWDSEIREGWFRKDRFLYWGRFSESSHLNSTTTNDLKEIWMRQGSEMVLAVLRNLTDEDWRHIDKIDEVLEPIYKWYRQNHEYFWESSFIGKNPSPMTQEKWHIAYMLDGVYYTLWGTGGICEVGGEKSVLSGRGSFPNMREQLALDLKNGWDGKTNRAVWREKKMSERIALQ